MNVNITEPAEAATEVGANPRLGEGAGVILWPLAVLLVVAAVATLAAWL